MTNLSAASVVSRSGQRRSRAVHGLCVALGCIYVISSWRYVGPAYQRDEVGYLDYAAALGGHLVDGASSYYAGYSLVLAPAFALFPNPFEAWRAVLVINGVLWACSFLLLSQCLRRWFSGASDARIFSAVLVTSIYPAWITFSGYAFSTTAFVTFFMAATLALGFWSGDGTRRLIPHSFLVGFLFWIHPTAAPVVAASLFATGVVAVQKRNPSAFIVHACILAALVIFYTNGLHPWLGMRMTPPGYQAIYHYPSLVHQLTLVATPGSIIDLAVMCLGSGAYVAVSSFGFALIGLLYCIGVTERPPRDQTIESSHVPIAARLFLVLAPAGIIVLGALSLIGAQANELDFWIYGRYVETTLLPLIAIGFVVLKRDSRLLIVSTLLVLTGIALEWRAPITKPNNLIDTVAFWPEYLWKHQQPFVWMLMGAVAIATTSLLGRTVGFGLMLLSFFVCTVAQRGWHDEILASYSAPPALALEVAREFKPGSCVGFDPWLPAAATSQQAERFFLNSYYLFNYRFRRMSPSEWLALCDGPYLTFDGSRLGENGKGRIVAQELASSLQLVERGAQASSLPSGVKDGIYWIGGTTDACLRHNCTFRSAESLSQISQVGRFNNGALTTDGREGYLFFGPYVPTPAGNYVVVLSGSFEHPADAVFDVTAGQGTITLASVTLNSLGLKKTDTISLPFSIKDGANVRDLEVRMSVSAETKLSVAGYYIEVH